MKNLFYAALAASLMCLLTGGIITLATAAPSADEIERITPIRTNLEEQLAAHLDAVIATQFQNIYRKSGKNIR